jgi:hypothetical protein
MTHRVIPINEIVTVVEPVFVVVPEAMLAKTFHWSTA